jgi:succinate-acetate transporter protein
VQNRHPGHPAIYLVVKGPKKLQTLGRMAIAFVVTVLLFIMLGAILRAGDPQALGAIGGLVGLLVAVIAGWWHTRSLKRDSVGTPETRK